MTNHGLVTMTLNFYSFVQCPGYLRFKNSLYKDSFFTAKFDNAIKDIVIANFKGSNLNLQVPF